MAGAGGQELPGAVLFACTMNSVRSPMAAAILRHLAGRRAYVESAGVRAGGLDAFAVAAMDEIGIDISQHAPHTLRDLHDTSFDLIISLSPEAHHQALPIRSCRPTAMSAMGCSSVSSAASALRAGPASSGRRGSCGLA